MNSDIMIDVVKKVFSTYKPGDMGLDLRDVIATQENIIKMLEYDRDLEWNTGTPIKSGSYIVKRNDYYLYPYCIDYYLSSKGRWYFSGCDVVSWVYIDNKGDF